VVGRGLRCLDQLSDVHAFQLALLLERAARDEHVLDINEPHASLLLHHLSTMHRAEVKPLLDRMHTQDLGTVAMEAFERLEDAEVTAWCLARMDPDALQAAIDEALTSELRPGDAVAWP
jgi:hypothetical protein